MKKTLILIGLILLVTIGGFLLFRGGKEKTFQEVEKKPEPTLAILPNKEGGEVKVKVLMVVAPKNFRDEELFEPKKVLEEKRVEIEIASKGVTEASGILGGKTLVDKDLSEIKVEDYGGVVFVGGPGSSVYFDDPKTQSLAKDAYEKGKVVGAICIAPSILANAGILKGKRATSFPSEAENLKDKGVDYTGEGVTVDGKIITAQGPDYATSFGEKIAEVLDQERR